MDNTVQVIPFIKLTLAFIPPFIVVGILYLWSQGWHNGLYAISRMLVQLLLVGYFLAYIFESKSVWVVLAVLAVMVFVSSWIALRTIKVQRWLLYGRALASIMLGGGATLNGRPLRLRATGGGLAEAIALVDFKRLPAGLAHRLASEPPFRSQRNLGSTALDWCWLAAGRADLYAHGGQRLWDYAGGALVFAEAGGSPCLLDSWDGDCRVDLTLRKRIAVAAAHPALQADWRAWLRAAG
jgi:hypothetical protein